MYIFCGLTPVGKTSIRWVSPEAMFILEVNQGLRCTSKEKQMHKSPFKVHCEYFAKMPPLRSCSFIPALFEDQNLVNSNKYPLKKSIPLLKKNDEIK